MTCRVLHNNELLVNEAHTNNFIFILDRLPTSFLVSKFSKDVLMKVDATLGSLSNAEAIREANQDVANLALFTQSVNLPELDLDFSTVPNQFASINIAVGRLNFADLNTNLVNDENWFIYRFIYYWLIAGHNPEQYNKRNSTQHFRDFHVNGYLLLLDNHRNKLLEIRFTDLHPKTLGAVDMKHVDAEKVILPVTWKYTDFYFTDDIAIKRV
jgi:hypothetical protein